MRASPAGVHSPSTYAITTRAAAAELTLFGGDNFRGKRLQANDIGEVSATILRLSAEYLDRGALFIAGDKDPVLGLAAHGEQLLLEQAGYPVERKLNLGGSLHDPTDPVGRPLFNVLAMVAEFESDLIKMRPREAMKVARAKGRLRGKQPKLNPRQEAHLVSLMAAGEHSTAA